MVAGACRPFGFQCLRLTFLLFPATFSYFLFSRRFALHVVQLGLDMWWLPLHINKIRVQFTPFGWSLKTFRAFRWSRLVFEYCVHWEFIIELVFELDVATLNWPVRCRVSLQRISHVCLADLSFVDVQRHGEFTRYLWWLLYCFPVYHEKWTMYSSVECIEDSMFGRFANIFRFWLLWSCNLLADFRLPCKLPALNRRYFLVCNDLNRCYCSRCTFSVIVFGCELIVSWTLVSWIRWLINSMSRFLTSLAVLVLRVLKSEMPLACWALGSKDLWISTDHVKPSSTKYYVF